MSEEKSKKIIAQLEAELTQKNAEIMIYRQELLKISNRLDQLMAQVAEDSKLLSHVQRTLIPTEIPNIPGFEISRKFVYGVKVGGDYFDIFEHDDKMKFGILVACSSGYAMSALFMSMILKISHIMEARKGNGPEKILQQIAEDIKKSAKTEDKTSAFYAVVDRRDFSLQFCSAGAIKAFYMAPQKPIQMLSSSAPAFGSAFNDKLQIAKVDLDPKSRLCVVTEGVTEVLSNEELAKIINDQAKNGVHDLRNEILFHCQRKASSEEPLRDQTVVVIDVKDRLIKLAK
jgi:sigma-B regulation protein RsbU (phosphoserine phosphatase)